MKRTFAIVSAVILGSGLLHISVAAGATTCSFAAATVTITISGGTPTTIVRNGDAIDVNGSACDAATVTNTDTIDVTVSDTSVPSITIDLSGGHFAPGLTDEGDGSSEIEFQVAAQASGIPFDIVGTSGDDTIYAGAGGIEAYLQINLNGAETVHDADVSMRLECCVQTEVTLEGRGGNDILSMAGDPGISGQYPIAGGNESGGKGNDSLGCLLGYLGLPPKDRFINGGPGIDTLDCSFLTSSQQTLIALDDSAGQAYEAEGGGGPFWVSRVENALGGAGIDGIYGGPGPSLIDGGAGDDLIGGGSGDDQLNGGPGSDIAVYELPGTVRGVKVDLSAGVSTGAGTDSLSNLEGVWGTRFDDTLVGDGATNVLKGFGGNDTLLGRAGPDELLGGGGDDSLDGGAGSDSCHGGPGSDTLVRCES